MPLWWSVTNVVGKDDRCYGRLDDWEEGEAEVLKPVTESLISASMMIGMRSITERNYKTFHRRLGEWSQVTETMFLHNWDNHVPHRYDERVACEFNPSLDDVKQHIGLATNVGVLSGAEFKKKLSRVRKENEYTGGDA